MINHDYHYKNIDFSIKFSIYGKIQYKFKFRVNKYIEFEEILYWLNLQGEWEKRKGEGRGRQLEADGKISKKISPIVLFKYWKNINRYVGSVLFPFFPLSIIMGRAWLCKSSTMLMKHQFLLSTVNSCPLKPKRRKSLLQHLHYRPYLITDS